jgi:hypothetical protein
LEDASVSSEATEDDDRSEEEDDRSVDVLTWETGELNVDDDTNALWSGTGSDAPM